MSGALKGELEALTGAYYEEAPEGAAYPYMVFSARRLTEDAGQQVYTLEVNAWDQHPYYSRAEGMMDVLEGKLHRCNYMTEGHLIRIFKGARQNIPDSDKTIKRVREQFEMRVYEMED
ncbi:hypothetical protein [uncultured Acetatifactor sp.]|uniref:hypothetical protein n=1 Tax=uncultured Acetatifactor sp. TaxID=1671927 RepID=UPI0026395401|nr:hypothetical protein [uncultured Acetatifactor sp.]